MKKIISKKSGNCLQELFNWALGFYAEGICEDYTQQIKERRPLTELISDTKCKSFDISPQQTVILSTEKYKDNLQSTINQIQLDRNSFLVCTIQKEKISHVFGLKNKNDKHFFFTTTATGNMAIENNLEILKKGLYKSICLYLGEEQPVYISFSYFKLNKLTVIRKLLF